MRPVAYVCMKDPAARARMVGVLERNNYAVIPQPTGFHLIRAIAGAIEGDQPWLEPSLIIVDALSPGCAGTTIAAGLRELGITIPVEVIATSADVDRLALRIDERGRMPTALHRRNEVAIAGCESRRP